MGKVTECLLNTKGEVRQVNVQTGNESPVLRAVNRLVPLIESCTHRGKVLDFNFNCNYFERNMVYKVSYKNILELSSSTRSNKLPRMPNK